MSSSVVVEWSAPTLAPPRGAVFSKPAGLRARVGLQHAGRDSHAAGRRQVDGAGERGHVERLAEAAVDEVFRAEEVTGRRLEHVLSGSRSRARSAAGA